MRFIKSKTLYQEFLSVRSQQALHRSPGPLREISSFAYLDSTSTELAAVKLTWLALTFLSDIHLPSSLSKFR